MELRPGIGVDDEDLDAFAQRHSIRRLAAFGSVLRGDFGPASDIDLLVEFEPDHVPGLLAIAGMELELEQMLGRPVDLRTYGDLSRYFRDQVRADAQELYAA
jgi:hypothetical protein